MRIETDVLLAYFLWNLICTDSHFYYEYTKCPKKFTKFVLHLPKYRFAVYF